MRLLQRLRAFCAKNNIQGVGVVWCDNPTSITRRGQVDWKEKIRGKAAKFGPKMIVSKQAI